jgi:hypothetical protein
MFICGPDPRERRFRVHGCRCSGTLSSHRIAEQFAERQLEVPWPTGEANPLSGTNQVRGVPGILGEDHGQPAGQGLLGNEGESLSPRWQQQSIASSIDLSETWMGEPA